jgi:hypothetical protein
MNKFGTHTIIRIHREWMCASFAARGLKMVLAAMAAATAATLSYPVLTIFDDSLDYRWTVLDGGPTHDLSAPGEQFGSETCARSMSALFDSKHRALALQSKRPVVLGEFVPLLLSFVLDSSEFSAPLPSCSPDLAPTRSECAADFCVSLRSDSTPEKEALHYPLCSAEQVRDNTSWIHVEAPVQAFGLGSRGSSLNQVVFMRGVESKQPWVLRIDDLRFASSRMLRVGDIPPSYGRSDNVVHSAIEGHGINNDSSLEAERCEYMSAEASRSQQQLPLCRMDGDHLDGQWVQTCDPRKIERPDRYAYGRALHQVPGKFGYRLCYRQSATERLRTMQAMSWSWQPRGCALAPVRGDDFDRWLDNRTILFVGDSLSAQSYYSLLWLLGDAVVDKQDMRGSEAYAPDTWSASKIGMCESTVGTEGGVLSLARLRSGGQLIKVLRHIDLVTDLSGAAFWLPYLERADITILNIGHREWRAAGPIAAAVPRAMRHEVAIASDARRALSAPSRVRRIVARVCVSGTGGGKRACVCCVLWRTRLVPGLHPSPPRCAHAQISATHPTMCPVLALSSPTSGASP